MDTRNLADGSSIGNAEPATKNNARTGRDFPTTGNTTGGAIARPGANAGPVSAARAHQPPGEGGELGFLTAYGSTDSHAVVLADGSRNSSPRAGKPYGRILWRGIAELVATPGARVKDRAQLVVLSTYAEHDGRTHEVQRSRGSFGGLAVDIDKGDPSLEQVLAALRQAVGDVEAYVYSSSSAEPGAQKWRILLPLARPIAGAEYADTQLGLFDLLSAGGLQCDPTLSRSAQPVYLPNVAPKRRGPDGRPLFYRWRILAGPRLEVGPGSSVFDARARVRARREAEEAAAAATAADNRERRLARVAATGDTFEPIEHFKQTHTVEQLLARYGFVRNPRGRGSHWRSPLSESGSYSTEDRGDHWVAVSAWAENHNVGRRSKNGVRYGDAFDLYVAFEHNGDRSAAVREYARQVRPVRPGARLHERPTVRVEPAEEMAGEVVEIAQYRRDIAQAVADVVLDGRPGLKLLRGDPGTGKTYAVARAVAKYPRGVVSVPGHELAAEVVEKLRAAGADAAAYPRLDESTCGNFETARRAQASGLSAPATVCPRCPLLRQCRQSGYLAGVREAEAAPHKVVTHARLTRSAARLTKDASYVVLEEDPSAALAPIVSATRRELERLADLAESYAAATERSFILAGADMIAPVEPLEEFAAWAPDEPAGDVVGPAVVPLAERGTRRNYPRGFFGSVCRVADTLAAAAARALAAELPDGVHEVAVEPVRDLPKNPEGAVWAAIDTIERVDPESIAEVGADAMRLAVAVATGRVERVFLQVETDARPGAGRRRWVEIVAQWRTRLPADRVPVFVNDGTLEADSLRRVSRLEVEDITPSGRTPLLHYAVQYPVDILPSTSSARVAAILAGIVRDHPETPRVGVLLHQRHYRELLEAEDSPLPPDVRERIVWSTYFGSGADRGTNTLHRVADLAVVIGTHRPPPSEIRRTLVRWGELEAAAGSATWGRIDRQGADHAGELVPYHGRGYAETAWARAADATIRATVRQNVGRARAIDPEGIPVVAVTSEATGLPVLDPDTLPVARPRVDELLAAVAGAAVEGVKIGKMDPEYRAKNPIGRYRENGAILPPPPVSLEDIETRLPGVPRRTVLRWMAEAVDAGLVVRTGAARATRYEIAATSSPPGPAPARPLSMRPVSLPETAPATVSIPAPSTVATTSPQRLSVVVEQKPPEPKWLEDVLDPGRHRDELLAAECFMAGPWAHSIGLRTAWDAEISRPLVLKLHAVATSEAKRRGQPPPPIDVVAGHTVTWYAVAAQAG